MLLEALEDWYTQIEVANYFAVFDSKEGMG